MIPALIVMMVYVCVCLIPTCIIAYACLCVRVYITHRINLYHYNRKAQS